MFIVEICEKFGWDLETYLNQPAWFLDLIRLKHQCEVDEAMRRNKQPKK